MTHLRKTLIALLAAAVLAGLAGCGGATADVPATANSDAFEAVETSDGMTTYAGHGIGFTVPEDWTEAYEEQKPESAYAWELHAPDGEPFAPFFNFTIGTEEEGEHRVQGTAEAARGTAELAQPGYEELAFEETEVAGAEEAWLYAFRREAETESAGVVPVDQQMVIFRTSEGYLVTVRFVAAEGTFDDTPLPAIRDSLVVNEDA